MQGGGFKGPVPFLCQVLGAQGKQGHGPGGQRYSNSETSKGITRKGTAA